MRRVLERMTAEKLFPDRRRCKSCGKGLGANGTAVYLGLFCTPRCAGMAEPQTDPGKAPRECKTERNGRWEFKRRYRSVGEIPERIRDDASVDHYWCSNHCGSLHIGHSRIRLDTEQFRMLQNPEDLADLLIKLRGAATHKDVAAVAGVRPIRIRELEQGIAHVDGLSTLFKVMSAYRSRVGVALRKP